MELKEKGTGGGRRSTHCNFCNCIFCFFHVNFLSATIKFIKRFVHVSADSWLHVRTLIKESRVRNRNKDCD